MQDSATPTHEPLPDDASSPPNGRGLGSLEILGLAALTALFFTGTFLLASWRSLWYDECLTFYLAELPEVSDLWVELSRGQIEQNPPLSFLCARGSMELFGDSSLAVRLPAAVGVWCLCLCLFLFVARRGARWGAWIALLFPLYTQANHVYAYEARPYGLMLGFTGLALVCWQAVEGRRRVLAVIGLALSLACLAATHYFGLFCFLALGAGELVRWVTRRRPDFAVAAAFLLGLLGLAACYPQLQVILTVKSDFWAKPDWYAIPRSYMELLGDAVVPIVGTLIVVGLHASVTAPRPLPENVSRAAVLPLHEAVAVAALALLPAVAVVVAKVLDGGYLTRYALPMVAGCSILLALLLSRIVESSTGARTLVLGTFLAWFLVKETIEIKWAHEGHIELRKTCEALVQAAPGDEPILVPEGLDFVKMVHACPDALVSRLVLPVNVPYNSDGPLLRSVPEWMGLWQEDYAQLHKVSKRFTIYGTAGGHLAARLQADGARVEVLPAVAKVNLYKVEFPPDR